MHGLMAMAFLASVLAERETNWSAPYTCGPERKFIIF